MLIKELVDFLPVQVISLLKLQGLGFIIEKEGLGLFFLLPPGKEKNGFDLFEHHVYGIHVGTNFCRSLQRALDRRLYLLLYGNAYGSPSGKPSWHFPEKIYDNEETLRKCAESALLSVLGDLSHTYFVGNAPMGHMVIQPADKALDSGFKRFFFKSQVIATNKFKIGKCQDFVWVTKDELLEYFPEQADYLNKMIIS